MKISIIIPVYLSEPFLESNFNNLTKQTYENLEIIYINDGSPDNSATICNGFAALDSRVIVIHQENAGAAAALNVGINRASGNFLMFLDADDWIELNTCELAVKAITEFNVDMVFWLNTKEFANKSVPVSSFFNNSKLFDNTQISILRRRMIGLVGEELSNPMSTDAFTAGWGKIFRAAVIKDSNVLWTDTKYVGSSDVLFNNQLMPFIKNAYYLNTHLHHYNRNNPNSLTKTYSDTLFLKFSNLFKELKIVAETYSKHDDYNLFLEALNNRIVLSIINIGLGYVSNGMSTDGRKKFIVLLKSHKYQEALKGFQARFLPAHFRVFFMCCKYGFYNTAYFLLFVMQKLR